MVVGRLCEAGEPCGMVEGVRPVLWCEGLGV